MDSHLSAIVGASNEVVNRANTLFQNLELVKDELETKIDTALGQSNDQHKFKFRPNEPPSFSGRYKD